VFLRNYFTWPKTQQESFPEGVLERDPEPKLTQLESFPEEALKRVSGGPTKTQPERVKGVLKRVSGLKTQPERVLERFPKKFVFGKPLEKVDFEYKRNIHFSVKTSAKNYRTRLSLLLLTWFQVVDKDQV